MWEPYVPAVYGHGERREAKKNTSKIYGSNISQVCGLSSELKFPFHFALKNNLVPLHTLCDNSCKAT